MATEKFCLRWNDFESNISVAFRELREEKDFFDVTLACDDNQVQAHKVILSACSPFFRNVLRKNPHQHPLLYLKGVKYQELLSVLNFMYQGEVNVAQEELNSFLAVAEELRVKGLTQSNSGNKSSSSPPHKAREPPPPERDAVPPSKKPRPTPIVPKPTAASSFAPPPPPASYDDDDIQEVAPVKSEPRDPAPAPPPQQQYEEGSAQGGTVALDDYGDYGDAAYDDGQYGEEGYDSYYDPSTGQPIGGDGNKAQTIAHSLQDREYADSLIRSKLAMDPSSRLWSCKECSYSHHRQDVMKKHVDAQHMSISYSCSVCLRLSSTQHALKQHQSSQHNCGENCGREAYSG